MTLNAASLKNVHKMHPHRKTVTLTRRNPTNSTTTEVKNVIKLKLSKQPMPGTGANEAFLITYLLPVASLGTVVPENGDWITEGTTVSTILSIDRELADTMFRCNCVEQ